jgi:hypothetical protein
MVDPPSQAERQSRPQGQAPRTRTRVSVEREGAQAAARNTVKTGRSCCRSRTPSFADRVAGAPDSDSRERGAGRGASCRKKHSETGRYCCRSRTPSFADRVAAADPSGCGKMRRLRRARRSVELGTCDREGERWPAHASANRRAHGPLRCTATQVQRCAGPPRLRSAPRTRSRAAWCGQGRRRLRSIAWNGACAAAPASGPWANESQPRYDLRRAPSIHPHFASNAIRGGLNQRFPCP